MPTGPRPRPPVRSIRLAMTGHLSSAPWANILWCHDSGSDEITETDLAALAAFAGNAWGSNLVTHFVTQSILENCHATLYGPDPDLLEADASLALAGTNSVGVTTAQQAVGVSWRTGVSWRGGHPRNYLAGVPSNMMATVQTITSSFATSVAAGANTFLSNVNGFTHGGITDLALVCMSFVRFKEWRTPPVAIPVASAHVDTRLDTIRNRLGPDVA